MIQLSSVRRLVDVLDVEECDETGEVGIIKFGKMSKCNSVPHLNCESQAASSLVAIVCRLTEDLRERM